MSLIMIIIKRDNDFTEILDIYKTYMYYYYYNIWLFIISIIVIIVLCIITTHYSKNNNSFIKNWLSL